MGTALRLMHSAPVSQTPSAEPDPATRARHALSHLPFALSAVRTHLDFTTSEEELVASHVNNALSDDTRSVQSLLGDMERGGVPPEAHIILTEVIELSGRVAAAVGTLAPEWNNIAQRARALGGNGSTPGAIVTLQDMVARRR